MSKILFLILILSFNVFAENLTIPDFSKINNAINKQVSGNLQEWCADCSKNIGVSQILENNFIKLGGDKIALKQALCFLKKYDKTKFEAKGNPNRSKGIEINNQRYITIQDLILPSSMPRLFVLDLQTGEVQVTYSSHGGGQKILGVRDESKDKIHKVSNESGTNLTARGFFITGSRRSTSAQWKFSMELHGIQQGINDNTFSRAILMHPYQGVEDKLFTSEISDYKADNLKGKNVMPLSWGCTMISPQYAHDIIEKIKAKSNSEGGSLYYNYTDVEKGYGPNYCGDENLLIKR